MIAGDPELQQALWLVKNGVPFDNAFALMRGGPEGQAEAYAMAVIFGEFEGGSYDWDAGRWKAPTT